MKHLEKTRDAALKMGAIFFCSRCHFKEKVIISGTKLTARLKFSVQLSLFTLGVQTQTVDLRLRHCPTEIKELLTNEKHSNELWVAVEQPWEDLILSRRKHIWCLFVKFNEQSPSCRSDWCPTSRVLFCCQITKYVDDLFTNSAMTISLWCGLERQLTSLQPR